MGSEGVCAGAEGGEIDTDQSEAVCDVFVIEGAVTDPALCAGEVINRFGALDVICGCYFLISGAMILLLHTIIVLTARNIEWLISLLN